MTLPASPLRLPTVSPQACVTLEAPQHSEESRRGVLGQLLRFLNALLAPRTEARSAAGDVLIDGVTLGHNQISYSAGNCTVAVRPLVIGLLMHSALAAALGNDTNLTIKPV